MEVEPASKTEFEEDILKHQESESKEITEINGNNDENDIEIDVKLSDTIKDKAKVNDNEATKENSNDSSEVLDNKLNTSSEINGNNTGDEDANNSDIKPKEESFKMEEDVEEEVKEEPMDQDADPEPEEPPYDPQDKSVKLEEPLFEDTVIEGFSFRAFDKYTVLEECCKWSAQNPGKVPDPWYKLNFRPKPLPPKPKPKPKPVKEKKEKELTKKQKEKLEKVSSLSASERGLNCDTDKSDTEKGSDRVSDPHFAKKSLNGVSPGAHPRPRANGAVVGGQQTGPLNFSLPPPSRYPAPAPAPVSSHHQPSRGGGLYRPYEVSPSSASSQQPRAHQNPAPRQIYSAPSTQGGQHQPAPSHYYPAPGQQLHPAYRPPGTTTAGPAPAHYKGYPHPQQQQYPGYPRHYPGYPGYPSQQPQHPGKYPGGQPSPHPSSQASPHPHSRHPSYPLSNGVAHPSQPPASRDSYSSSYSSSGEAGSKHHPWHSSAPVSSVSSAPGYPVPSPVSTLAPHSRPPSRPGHQPGAQQPGPPLHRPDLDPRYPSASERAPAPAPAVPGLPPAPGAGAGQGAGSHASAILPPTPMMKDVPKLGGPDSLFYRAGLDPLPPPRLAPAPATTAPGAGQRLQQAPAEHGAKKTGKWNAMHVRIAWEIYNHQKSKAEAKPGPGLTPSSAPGAGPKLGTFGDLLSKPGGVPGAGAEYGKRPAPAPAPAPAPGPAPATLFPGLPPPPNPFDPRDPFGAQRYYGTSHLGSYPRYPASAASAAPFGGLGGILPAPAPARTSLPATSTATSLSGYPGYPAPAPRPDPATQEAERRARQERERRHKEESEARRDSELRLSREGFPAYVRDRDRNGDTAAAADPAAARDRSPVRGQQPEPGPDRRVSGAESGAVDMTLGGSKPGDGGASSQQRPASAVSSRPSSVMSHVEPGKTSSPGQLSLHRREERICDDISIIAEKPGDGSRSGTANSVTRCASGSSDHSVTRQINGGPGPNGGLDPGLNGVKSEAMKAAVPSYLSYPGAAPRPGPPPVSSYLAHPGLAPPPADPRSLAMFSPAAHLLPGPQQHPSLHRQPSALDPYGAAAAASYSAALDPYRDPFRLDLALAQHGSRVPGVDPLREARERELLRLGAAHSLSSELERAKAAASAAYSAPYPGMAPGYPGYPPTTLATAAAQAAAAQASAASLAAHKMGSGLGLGSPHLAPSLYPGQASLHPGMYPSTLGYPPAGLNGSLPGHGGQYNGKDPLRR